MKERIESFDFIRAICAWIIVVYHFADICITTPQFTNFPFFYTYANGRWGETTVVTIFFMISGASLYYNHPVIHLRDAKKFFWTRFKGIFPMFYMLWLFLYYKQVCGVKHLFYNGNPKYLLLTLFGMDGYMSYRYTPNYYFIGEWFLGALILLYLCYPLLTWCMEHAKILTTLVLLGGFASLYFTDFFMISKERNLITCLLAFWLGMLFIRYRSILTKWQLVIPAAVCAVILLFFPLGADMLLCMQFTSIALFFAIFELFLIFVLSGNMICASPPILVDGSYSAIPIQDPSPNVVIMSGSLHRFKSAIPTLITSLIQLSPYIEIPRDDNILS